MGFRSQRGPEGPLFHNCQGHEWLLFHDGARFHLALAGVRGLGQAPKSHAYKTVKGRSFTGELFRDEAPPRGHSATL